jgi:succinyl-CoA synthetase beta subunit
MDLFKKYDIETPVYSVVHDASEVKQAVSEITSKDIVVKAQVLAGGRGKGKWLYKNASGGGVQMATSSSLAENIAASMLGNSLVTKQTDAKGRPCNSVLLSERVYNRKETYFSILLDRDSGGPVLVGSSEGGMDIEAVAAETPELIFKEPIDIFEGVQPEQVRPSIVY